LFSQVNLIILYLYFKDLFETVATQRISYFAVSILVRHTGIQSPNNSHVSTHTHTLSKFRGSRSSWIF